MANAASANFQKVMKKCPNCGQEGPKELVSGPKRMNTVAYIIVGVLTGGIGFLFPGKFKKSGLEAFCPACNKSFNPGSF